MNMMRIKRRVTRFFTADGAVSALEYAILVGVVVVGIAAALGTFQTEVTKALGDVAGRISGLPGITP